LVALGLFGAIGLAGLTGCGGENKAAASGPQATDEEISDSSAAETSTSGADAGPGPAGADAPVDEPTTTTTSPAATTTAPPSSTTAPPTTAAPAAVEEVKLRQGDSGAGVLFLEDRLAGLGYRPGEVDGKYDSRTASAVMAFQKREGLGRDGVAGPETAARLPDPSGAGPRNLAGPRIEVDLDRQVLFAVNADGTFVTVNISSGNGKAYAHPNGGTAKAITPVGDFAIDRKIDGNRKAPLGTLYRPMYFKGGFAVHGSPSVPGFPASHGCVRTANADQDYLFPLFGTGTPVVLYSGDKAAPSAKDVDPNVDPGG
jgi:peptidoglycan hydrolase-like protein with peptidoglycan-binding domain